MFMYQHIFSMASLYIHPRQFDLDWAVPDIHWNWTMTSERIC